MSVMGRLWVCLPLCLALQDQNPLPTSLSDAADLSAAGAADPKAKWRIEVGSGVAGMTAASPLPFPAALPWARLRAIADHLVPRHERIGLDVTAGLAAASAAGPSYWPLRETLIKHGQGLVEDVCY